MDDSKGAVEDIVDINAKLIKIMQSFPQLYNQENVCSEMKQQYWLTVTNKLGEENPSREDVTQVRQRWKNLRDSYVKDFKMMRMKEQDNLKLRKRWRYANEMTFLNPFICLRGPSKKKTEIATKLVMEEGDSEENAERKRTPVRPDLLLKWIESYPDLILKDDRIFCNVCQKIINPDNKYKVAQHMRTTQHMEQKLEVLKNAEQEYPKPHSTNVFQVDFNDFAVSNNSQSTSASETQLELTQDDAMLIENIKKEEEYDDIFNEQEEKLTITKEEIEDIVNQHSSGAEEGLGAVLPKKEIIFDDHFTGEPPRKKSRTTNDHEVVSTSNLQAGPSYQFPGEELNQESDNHIAAAVKEDPASAGMIDTSGNLDFFFESILRLAKTLNPLDQMMLQRNIADAVFRMKIAQLKKKGTLT